MFIFALKESFKSIRRAKLSFVFSLLSVSVGLFLISLSLFFFFVSDIIEEKIIDSFKINAYLNESISSNDLFSLQNDISAKDFCKGIKYISKEKAKELFIKETGNDFSGIIEYNPLPASLIISLNQDFFNETSLKSIKSYFENIPFIDSFDFQHSMLLEAKSFIENSRVYFWSFTIILIIIAIYIVYSTMRLILDNKSDEIQTMKLVGASKSIIKLPILLSGLFLGIFADIILFLVYSLIYMIFKNELNSILLSNYYFVFTIAIITFTLGPLKGLVISWFSVRSISFRVK